MENSVLTVSHTKTTESETESSSTIEESITTEKEKSTPVKSKQTETSSIIVIKEEPDKTVKIKETSELSQEMTTESKEEIVEQVIADFAEVERLVIQYINEFRVAQGDTIATVLPGLTEVAQYRVNQLIDNFSHVDIREAFAVNGKIEISVPKTKSSIRTVVLPPSLVEVLRKYKETISSRWIFPSPNNPDVSRYPTSVGDILSILLKRAGCKHVRFHDLRHTFATRWLENGMDVKTLSSIIGHVSAATTLDIYSHITDEMLKNASRTIDRGIGKANSRPENEIEITMKKEVTPPPQVDFEAYKGKIRKSGTGGIYKLNDHLYEGRYTPTNAYGKRESCNVYAKTYEECEVKLEEMIAMKRAEIAAEKERLKAMQTA